MAFCPGKRGKGSCNSAVFKCKKCGSVGCDDRQCTNYSFDYFKCLKCDSDQIERVD